MARRKHPMDIEGRFVKAPRAVLKRDPHERLDAVLSRLGGVHMPKPLNGRVVLPDVGKRHCPGQQELFADDTDNRDNEDEKDATG